MKRLFALPFALLLLAAASHAAEPADEGFTPLFDGQTLAGWQGGTDGYKVEDGSIVSLPMGSRNLTTIKEYGDFDLKFEFKLTPGANNGIGIRVPTEEEGKRMDAAYKGMEIQVIDDSSERYKDIKPWQHHGSIYGVVPAKTGFLKAPGEWNSEEIIAKGSHIKVILNGETIVDADVAEASKDGTIDKREHPGLTQKSGHICFCGHGAEVWFRNLRIKELQ